MSRVSLLPRSLTDQTKLAFEFAKEISSLLITLATGVIAAEVTLLKDLPRKPENQTRIWLLSSWLTLFLSVGFGVGTILALTGVLGVPGPEPDIFAGNVRFFSMTQILLFLVGILMTIVFGYRQFWRKH